MKTKIAMQAQKLKYFSALSPKQKDKTVFMIRKLKNRLEGLPDGLARQILNSSEQPPIRLEGCKMFKHEGIYYPLNFGEIIKN